VEVAPKVATRCCSGCCCLSPLTTGSSKSGLSSPGVPLEDPVCLCPRSDAPLAVCLSEVGSGAVVARKGASTVSLPGPFTWDGAPAAADAWGVGPEMEGMLSSMLDRLNRPARPTWVPDTINSPSAVRKVSPPSTQE
jgi:hypothetical protein